MAQYTHRRSRKSKPIIYPHVIKESISFLESVFVEVPAKVFKARVDACSPDHIFWIHDFSIPGDAELYMQHMRVNSE